MSQWEIRKRDHTKIREKFAKILESDLGEAAKSQVRVFLLNKDNTQEHGRN